MEWSKKYFLLYEPLFWYCMIGAWTLSIIWKRRKLYKASFEIPGPISYPLIGNAPTILAYGITNSVFMFKRMIETYGDGKVTRMWFGPDLHFIVGDASVAWQINKLCLTKADVYQHLADPYLRKGIFVDKDISHWKSSRKLVVMPLAFKSLKTYIPIFHQESLNLIDKWKSHEINGESFHLTKTLEVSTFKTIKRTMLGINQDVEDELFINCLHRIFQHFQRKIFNPIFRHILLYTLLGHRADERRHLDVGIRLSARYIDSFNSKEAQMDTRVTMGKALMNAELSYGELRAQIVTVLGAGLDTSMLQNSILLILYAIHPAIQNKVYQEIIEELGEDYGKCPIYEDIMKLEYMERTIKECLRMYPAAPVTGRKINEDITVTKSDGKEILIPAGSTAFNCIFYIQNSPHYYENPEVFDPDRWLPENMAKRDPQCYMPFSSGPRNCIGGKYSILQMKVFMATILRHYEILPSDQCKCVKDIRVKMNLTMELEERCQVKVRRRTKLQ